MREFIERAFEHGRGDDNAEIVLADLKAKGSLLWIAWAADDRKIIAAAVTKIIKTWRGLICLITACGGVDLVRWKHMIGGLEDFARAEGCIAIRMEARKGWAAVFTDYREPWIVLEKRLS